MKKMASLILLPQSHWEACSSSFGVYGTCLCCGLYVYGRTHSTSSYSHASWISSWAACYQIYSFLAPWCWSLPPRLKSSSASRSFVTLGLEYLRGQTCLCQPWAAAGAWSITDTSYGGWMGLVLRRSLNSGFSIWSWTPCMVDFAGCIHRVDT